MINVDQSALRRIIGEILDAVGDGFTLTEVHACGHQLRAHANTSLSRFPEARNWDFSVDYFAIATTSDGNTGLVLVNIAKSALGLTELGELHAYTRGVRPLLSIQLAPTGLSRDLYSLLLRPEVSNRVLKWGSSPIWIYAGVEISAPFSLDAFFPPLRLG